MLKIINFSIRSVEDALNYYSFAVSPEHYKPSGTCNFSRGHFNFSRIINVKYL